MITFLEYIKRVH